MGRRAVASWLASLCVLAGCTSAPQHPAPTRATRHAATTRPASGPPGAADLLATRDGVVWSFHLVNGSGTVLRSADAGRTWHVVLSPHPSNGFGLVASYFRGDARAWAVQEREDGTVTVHRTSDGGRSWRAATVRGTATADAPTFDQIGFSDATHGWLLAAATGFATDGADTLVLAAWRTTDAGATWTPLPPDALPLQGIRLATYGSTACPNLTPPHLTFATGGTGWFTSGNCEHGLATPSVWRTSDLGAHWSRTALPAPAGGWGRWNVVGHGGAEVGPVAALDSAGTNLLVPVAVGRSGLVVESSDDSGRTWQITTRVDTRAAPSRKPAAEVFDVIDARHWVVAATGGILRTADAGRSWSFTRSGIDSPEQPISFTSLRNGFRAGTGLVIAQHTPDAGRRWTASPAPVSGRMRVGWADDTSVSTVAAAGGSALVAGGGSGLLVSHDGGRSWRSRLPETAPVQRFDIVDSHVMFAVTGAALLRSVDGGLHWAPIRQPESGPVSGVQFSSATTGVATLADQTGAFRTTDAGATWTPLNLPAGWSIRDASIADPSPGSLCVTTGAVWAVGSGRHSSAIFVSRDQGRTWRKTLSRSDVPQLRVAGCAGRIAWALLSRTAGGMGRATTAYELLRSTDDGRSWSDALRGPGEPHGQPVGFTTTSGHAAWLTAESQSGEITVAVTHDTGRTWTTTQVTPNRVPLAQWLTTTATGDSRAWVLFAGPKQTGVAALFTTSDGGRRWHQLTTFTWSQ